jgi:hypothetical protein
MTRRVHLLAEPPADLAVWAPGSDGGFTAA